jgi:hypothetical protein
MAVLVSSITSTEAERTLVGILMSDEIKANLIVSCISAAPYAAVAWGYSYFTKGDASDFWQVLGILILVRAFFGVIEFFGSILTWRLYLKDKVVQHFVGLFKANNMPPKHFYDDDFGNYRARLMKVRQPDPARFCQEMEDLLLQSERRGIVYGMRIDAAAETAFEKYQATQPKAEKSRFDNFRK